MSAIDVAEGVVDNAATDPVLRAAGVVLGAVGVLALGGLAVAYLDRGESPEARASRIVRQTLGRSSALNAARTRATPLPADWDHLAVERGVLRTPDGEIPVEEIGRGLFATVYREVGGRRVFALVPDDVHDKEIASMAGVNAHVPAVERIGHTRDRTVYAMPLYRAPLRKADSPIAWRDYRALRACAKATEGSDWSAGRVNERLASCLDDVARDGGLTPGVAEGFRALADMATNFAADDYAVEFAPRNLATDEAGRLVLLDVLFDLEAARKRFAEKRARRAAREDRWARR